MDQIDSGRIVNYYDRLISHEIARPPLGIATTGLLLFMVYYSVFNQFTYFDVGALQTMVIYLPTRLIVWEIARQTPSCFQQLIFIIFIRINRADENIRRSERRIRRISIFPIIWWSASIVVIVKEIWKFSKILNPGILYSISRNERKREETRHFRVEISAGPSIRKEQREEKRERERKRDCQNRTCPITVTSCWNWLLIAGTCTACTHSNPRRWREDVARVSAADKVMPVHRLLITDWLTSPPLLSSSLPHFYFRHGIVTKTNSRNDYQRT